MPINESNATGYNLRRAQAFAAAGINDGDVRGHQGVIIEGRRAGVRQAVKAAGSALTLHPHPKLLSGSAWHCRDSNRLFSVRATHAEGEDIAAKVRNLIKCH